MPRPFQPLPQRRHGFRQPALLAAHPQGSSRACDQKAGSVRLSAAVFLLGDRPAVIVRRTVARRSIGRANPVPILRNLHRRPIVFAQRGNQSGHHAGLPHASRVPANHDDRHIYLFFPSLASAANCFRYSLTGCAGVPQKATPLPRSTLLGSTPPCPPSITPSSMRACSPMPTCPPSTTSFSITMLPESPVCAAITTFCPSRQLCPMCTRLSIFVPRPIRVSSSAPRSIVVFAPISTSSSITSLPTCGNFSYRPLFASRTYPKPSLPRTAPAC